MRVEDLPLHSAAPVLAKARFTRVALDMLCGLPVDRQSWCEYNFVERDFMLLVEDAVFELLQEDAPEKIRWIRRVSRRKTVQFIVSLDSVYEAQAAINKIWCVDAHNYTRGPVDREDMGFTLEIYDGELEITSNRNMHIQASLPLCDPELTQKAWQFIRHNSDWLLATRPTPEPLAADD